jgi:hypothetical protein
VSQPISKVVGKAPGENLGLVFQPPKCPRVNNAVSVALKVVAVGMGSLRIATSARVLYAHRILSKHQRSLAKAACSFWCPHSDEHSGKESAPAYSIAGQPETAILLLLLRLFASKLHFCRLKFLLDLRNIGGFRIGSDAAVVLVEGALPVSCCLLQATHLEVHIA